MSAHAEHERDTSKQRSRADVWTGGMEVDASTVCTYEFEVRRIDAGAGGTLRAAPDVTRGCR